MPAATGITSAAMTGTTTDGHDIANGATAPSGAPPSEFASDDNVKVVRNLRVYMLALMLNCTWGQPWVLPGSNRTARHGAIETIAPDIVSVRNSCSALVISLSASPTYPFVGAFSSAAEIQAFLKLTAADTIDRQTEVGLIVALLKKNGAEKVLVVRPHADPCTPNFTRSTPLGDPGTRLEAQVEM